MSSKTIEQLIDGQRQDIEGKQEMETAANHNLALRRVVQARILLGNSVSELEALDSLTDEWNAEVDQLETAAIEIHLQCDYAVKEANTILEALNGLLANTLPLQECLWIELELRQESALAATLELTKVLDKFGASITGPEQAQQLGVKEMKLRAQHVLSKLKESKDVLAQLQKEVQEWTMAETELVVDCAFGGETPRTLDDANRNSELFDLLFINKTCLFIISSTTIFPDKLSQDTSQR
ncbi:Hypothetical predicted protein [Lecanosticta acicola]|uniref:Uncharacterized protein n=1 Tax=Lecanosticta acicola TaxID=111012 RepID=A0AAI9E639_9PEZI|nr:Hypothetical predicted protein [Lecanosticta acicola]